MAITGSTRSGSPGISCMAVSRVCRQTFLALVLLGAPVHTAGSSELNRLALAIAAGEPAMRAEFATVAIFETASAFAEEAERARLETPASRRSDTARWARAVDAYATDLWDVVDSITELTPVGIRISAANHVELTVAGNNVEVGGPRPAQQAEFEQRIVKNFCERYRCEDLVTDFSPATRPQAAINPVARWSFTGRSGPVCSNDAGLEFQFRDAINLRQKREACERVVAELEQLAELVAGKVANGVRIDWHHLDIHGPAGDQQQVELNTDGDSLSFPLPALAASGKLFVLVRPWLSAKVRGTPIRQVIINADPLMEPLFSP